MTAVVATRVNGVPMIVGDVALSDESGQRYRDCYAGKVYEVGRNVVLGWCGRLGLAADALGRLRDRFRGGQVSPRELEFALADLSDLCGQPEEHPLDLTGWIVDGQPRVVRWSNRDSYVLFSNEDSDIGEGGEELRERLRPPPFRDGTATGTDQAVLQAAGGFIEARFEEMFRPSTWHQTWGAAYDLLAFVDRRFRWLPNLIYVAWDVSLDEQNRVVDVVQWPYVFKHERVHNSTLMQFKEVGGAPPAARVALPIDSEAEPGIYTRRGFSAKSDYCANCFRLFRDGRLVDVFQMTIQGATQAGFVHHDSADEEDPVFAVERDLLQRELTNMFEAHKG